MSSPQDPLDPKPSTQENIQSQKPPRPFRPQASAFSAPAESWKPNLNLEKETLSTHAEEDPIRDRRLEDACQSARKLIRDMGLSKENAAVRMSGQGYSEGEIRVALGLASDDLDNFQPADYLGYGAGNPPTFQNKNAQAMVGLGVAGLGLLLTVGSLALASNSPQGGRYVIFTGLIIGGLVMFFRSLGSK